jgi:hypothetical protein
MNEDAQFERCLTYINTDLEAAQQPLPAPALPARAAVTISREAGTGAHAVAEKLAELLQKHAPENARPWTVFDRNLVERVLEDQSLPKRLARFMPEDRVSAINDMVEELCGLHPPSWILVRKTAETILHLAELGNVILVGRGAPVITANLEHVFYVRLVGPIEKRVASFQRSHSLSPKDAVKAVEKEDRARRRYVKRYFKRRVEDCLLYDLIINMDRITPAEAARLIGEAVAHRLQETAAAV